MKNYSLYDKMEMTIINTKEFAAKHDRFKGLSTKKYLYLTAGLKQSDTLFNAIINAYNIGFRRGYNRAVKDQAGKPADQ